MRSIDKNNEMVNASDIDFTLAETKPKRAKDSELAADVVVSPMAYNEMADVPVQLVDPVEMVERNLAHLVELQSRMKFMMKEIRYLLKV